MPQSRVRPRTIAPPLEPGAPSDFELMKGIQAGDPDALSQLYDRYNSILKALILRVIHNEAEADDLLQEIFMEIWNQAQTISEQKGKPLGWTAEEDWKTTLEVMKSSGLEGDRPPSAYYRNLVEH